MRNDLRPEYRRLRASPLTLTLSPGRGHPHPGSARTAPEPAERLLPSTHLHQAGFVLTLELLLLSTVFLVVLISGLALLREALTRVARERMMSSVLVADSDGNIIGRARGFDEADAPRVLLREPESRVAVLLAVRTTRFASRQAVYFDQAGCRGAAFLFAPFSELGTTSELGALQRRAYGVGPGSGLYLSPPDALPGSPLVASRWVSSRGGPDNLCEGLSPQAVPGLIAAERVLSLGDLYRPPYSVPVPEAVAGDSAGPTRW